MKRIPELASIAAAAIALAACGSTDAGAPSTTASSAPPAASAPMSGSTAAPAASAPMSGSRTATASGRRIGPGQAAVAGDQATKALNMLVSSGYGSFTEFQPHGDDFTAVVARGGERTPMLIDPGSGRITAFGSGGEAMSGSSAPPAR